MPRKRQLVYRTTLLCRVTSVKQFSIAEFSGEEARPKVYENGHRKVLVL